MKAQKDCFTCLRKQVMAHSLKLEEFDKFLDDIPKDEDGVSLSFSPPKIAISLYEKIAKELKIKDPFQDIKRKSIQKAYKITKELKRDFSLDEAIRLSALGNVIDYGSASAFDIETFDFKNVKLDFSCFEFEAFLQKLKKCQTLVLLADNAGENLFDEILLEVLNQDFPNLQCYYFVRGRPIINDLTLQDLKNNKECKNIFGLAKVIDSGVKSPGFIYEDATKEAQMIFDSADLILSKGMGNFECLEDCKDTRIFFLFKIKCQVIARFLNFPLGNLVLKQSY